MKSEQKKIPKVKGVPVAEMKAACARVDACWSEVKPVSDGVIEALRIFGATDRCCVAAEAMFRAITACDIEIPSEIEMDEVEPGKPLAGVLMRWERSRESRFEITIDADGLVSVAWFVWRNRRWKCDGKGDANMFFCNLLEIRGFKRKPV
ncbi:MAG: hypothetical protein HUU55_07540 [Myxococcales bacterium]|nr:hypothetical protein [Myxococcales bacterium]